MKKIVATIVAVILLIGCGNNMWIDGKEKETVGIVNILVDDPSLSLLCKIRPYSTE